MNENYAENIENLISKFAGITIVGTDASREVTRYLAQGFTMRTLGAALRVAKQQARLNDHTDEHTAEAMDDLELALLEQHREVVAHDLQQPEEALHENMAKAKYFYHQLPPNAFSMKETCDRIIAGNPDDDMVARVAKQRQVTEDQARQILGDMNAASNADFKHEVYRAAVDITKPPQISEEPHFTEDDYYVIVDKLIGYIGTKSRGFGDDEIRGNGFLYRLWHFDRRIRTPRGLDQVEADSELLDATLKELLQIAETRPSDIQALVGDRKAADEAREGQTEYTPHEGTTAKPY